MVFTAGPNIKTTKETQTTTQKKEKQNHAKTHNYQAKVNTLLFMLGYVSSLISLFIVCITEDHIATDDNVLPANYMIGAFLMVLLAFYSTGTIIYALCW